MNDIKLLTKNEKEFKILVKGVIIYSQDIGMEFGRKTYAILMMRNGNPHMMDGIKLPNQEKIRMFRENETYKYKGRLETETIKQLKMKEKILKGYLRRTSKPLETKLYCKNLIKGIIA